MSEVRYHQMVGNEFVDGVIQPLASAAEQHITRRQVLLAAAGVLGLGAARLIKVNLPVANAHELAAHRTSTSPQPPAEIKLAPATTQEIHPTTTTTQPPPRPDRIQNEPLRPRLEGKLEQIPTLQELSKLFPNHYGDWQKQLEHIAKLREDVHVSPDDYMAFTYNDTYKGAFANTKSYNQRISPGLIVLHWTVTRYPAGLEGGLRFVQGLINTAGGPHSSNYFIDYQGEHTYRYFDEDTRMAAGAKGMNRFAINIELEAGRLNEQDLGPAVIYDVKPLPFKKMVLNTTEVARRYNLATSKYAVIGHVAGSAIFDNPTFNPITRSLISMRKFDMPQELVQVVVDKAHELDMQLG